MDIFNLAYTDSYGSSGAGGAAIMAFAYLLVFLFSIAGYLISSFLFMKVFERAGVQGKWRAWVPVYNYMVFAKLGDMTPWVIVGVLVLGFIPIVNIFAGLASYVALIMIAVRVNAKFGREWPILLLFILGPLGFFIWLAISAFGGNSWNPAAAPRSPWATSFLAEKTVWNGIPVQPAQSVAGSAGGTGYGAPSAPAAQGYVPPAAPPAQGYAPPQTPPASGTTPPPPAPPAGPQV